MLFSSTTFLFAFLPIIILLYFLVKKTKIKNAILLVFSLVFYSWGEPKYILLMLITVIIAYLFGFAINNSKSKKSRTAYLVASIVLILSFLFIFKYFDFFIEIFNVIFSSNIPKVNLILPIGISFYTFQILTYIIDLYKKKVKLQNNYFKLLLYVSFFPQLIAGPIVRYETIAEEIDNRDISVSDFTTGFKRFIVGLSKKIIIANNAAVIADNIFSSYSGLGSNILWFGAIAYSIQIYFDFSGYSDMAIGLGRIFGFHFLENFNYPYISKSVTDFWRRWHISLSSFFRDYIYIPLGGNKKGVKRQIVNLLIIWGLTGLWHGANYNFVIWGLYYAFWLILEKFVLKKMFNKLPDFFKHIYALLIVIVGWVIFRVENITDLYNLVIGMFNFSYTSFSEYLLNNLNVVSSIPYLIFGVIVSLPIYTKIFNESSRSVPKTIIEDLLLGILIGVDIMMLTANSYNPFIYFRF